VATLLRSPGHRIDPNYRPLIRSRGCLQPFPSAREPTACKVDLRRVQVADGTEPPRRSELHPHAAEGTGPAAAAGRITGGRGGHHPRVDPTGRSRGTRWKVARIAQRRRGRGAFEKPTGGRNSPSVSSGGYATANTSARPTGNGSKRLTPRKRASDSRAPSARRRSASRSNIGVIRGKAFGGNIQTLRRQGICCAKATDNGTPPWSVNSSAASWAAAPRPRSRHHRFGHLNRRKPRRCLSRVQPRRRDRQHQRRRRPSCLRRGALVSASTRPHAGGSLTACGAARSPAALVPAARHRLILARLRLRPSSRLRLARHSVCLPALRAGEKT
jgi:hypothetical protein